MSAVYTPLMTMDLSERKIYMEEQGDLVLSELLKDIGDPTNELHDKIVFRLFVELLAHQMWTEQQLKKLATSLPTSEYLFASIGATGDDTVFRRSFSALWLAHILQYDRQFGLLTEQEAVQVMEAASSYIAKERDVRGFIDGKGWAHSMAHGADLAVAIVTHHHFQQKFAPVILQSVKAAFWKGTVYIDDEEERFAQIIEQLLAINFPEEVLIEWVEQVFDKLDAHLNEIGYTPAFFHARTNTMRFMRTLYFTAKFSNKAKQLQGVTSIFISKWAKL
ncbi:DUF2785 domain-containing protein [Solibacillus sp. CAU 1738]|uniref:DUF2785 domain-containing protein n=1 Tax=Solibacillus sp. CAU 1738 TaxID=3140363 RepID=UPI003260DF74